MSKVSISAQEWGYGRYLTGIRAATAGLIHEALRRRVETTGGLAKVIRLHRCYRQRSGLRKLRRTNDEVNEVLYTHNGNREHYAKADSWSISLIYVLHTGHKLGFLDHSLCYLALIRPEEGGCIWPAEVSQTLDNPFACAMHISRDLQETYPGEVACFRSSVEGVLSEAEKTMKVTSRHSVKDFCSSTNVKQ